MTPENIIREAQAEGVILTLFATGTIKATGNGAAVSRWLPAIREHKPEIIAELQSAANDPSRDELLFLSKAEEKRILTWLASIGETDAVTIGEVIDKCRYDLEARAYFTGRAVVELPEPDSVPDDRRTCEQCANLISRRCTSAKRGEILASRKYEPIRDLPRRCEGYAPGAGDPERRPGRKRWPGLTQKGVE